ncbi:MAG: hypothetical protein ACPLPR_08620 [Bacillota bacterium]
MGKNSLVSDIDNTLNALNLLIYRTFSPEKLVYPVPLPEGFWSTPQGMGMLWQAPPIPEVHRMLCALGPGSIIYVTCRPRETEDMTRRWLRRHGFPEGPIEFCGGPEEKVKVALQVGATVALEDDPQCILAYIAAGIPVGGVVWWYNKHFLREGAAFKVPILSVAGPGLERWAAANVLCAVAP